MRLLPSRKSGVASRKPVPRLPRLGWGLQALLILSLLTSMAPPFAPLAPTAAAQEQPLPPPLPAPFQVSLSGSFQTALGCPADFDPSCPQTQLQDARDGSWAAVLPVPPGDYAFRVVASSDAGAASLGQNGDPNGNDLSLSVPADAAGAYFRYNSLTGEITAEPVRNLVTLVTDIGEQFPMAPSRRGGYQLTWDAQAGNYGFQVLFNGQPVAQDSVSLDEPRRVIVAVDDNGAVTAKDTVRGTTVDVAAVDANGAPRVDSCFAITDRDGRLRSQTCDVDDGQADGVIRLRVPDGLEEADYTVRETRTGEGSVAAAEQRIELGPGRAEITAPSAGDAAGQEAEAPTPEPAAEAPPASEPAAPGQVTIEPGEQPGRLTIVPVDPAGQPLPGACFAIVEFGFELCDDDLDGTVFFDAVPPTSITLRQTAAPAGFAPVADFTVDLDPSGAVLRVPHQPATQTPVEPAETPPPAVPEETPGIAPIETPAVAPVETPQTAPQDTGQVVLATRDQDGNPVTGACWSLTGREDGGSIERCDGDDGDDDGRILFEDVSTGRYRIDEVATPPGFQPAESQSIDVAAGAISEFVIEYRVAQGRAGRLVIDVTDENGNPVPQTCFDLRGPLELADICDRQDDGRLNIPDLPAGEYTVTQTRTAEGLAIAAETTVIVPEDETVELPLTNRPAGADRGQEVPAETGQIEIAVLTADGGTVPGACVTLNDGSSELSVCDDTERDTAAESGRVAIVDLSPGQYTLRVDPPEGFTAPDPAPIQVVANELARFEIVLEAAQSTGPGTGSLSIFAEDEAGGRLPGGCYTLELGEQVFGPFCDEDSDGQVPIENITPGPVAIVESTPPAGAAAAEPNRQETDIVAGEEAQITFRPAAPEPTPELPQVGTVVVRVVDGAGQPVAACVELSGDEGSVSVCDNREQDENTQAGLFRIRGVPFGPYTVALSGLPEGIPAPEPQTIEVAAEETDEIVFTLGGGPGTLAIFVEDDDGQRIGGACFTLSGPATLLEDVCDQGDDGTLNFPDLPAGEYIVTQTRAGEGRTLAPEQTVTVSSGQTVEITVRNSLPESSPTTTPEPTAEPEPTTTPETQPEPDATAEPTPDVVVEQPAELGTFTVVNLAPDGALLGGGCFRLTDANEALVAEQCDNQPGDFDNGPGVIAFGGLAPGAYTLTQTRAAEGFTPAAPAAIQQGPSPQAIDVVSEAAAQETGTVELEAFDDAGNPLTGQCYTLAGSAGSFGPYCDNGDGDTSTDPGVLVVEGLPTGTYEAVLQLAPEDASIELAQAVRQRRSVSVRRGERPTRVRFDVRAQQNRRGSLLIRVRDQEGNYLAGACFGLIPDGATDPEVEVCDNRRGDENSSDGRILLSGLRDGRYTLAQTTAPTGYSSAADQSVRVTAGDVREVAVTNRIEREQTASLAVETVDPDGNLLPSACYTILRGAETIDACDADDGNDGITSFADIPSGSYVVRQTQPPSGGFSIANSTATRLDPGQSATVTVTNERRPGSLVIRKTDQGGQLLAGSCFALRSGDRNVYSVCDNDASDGNRADGVMLLGTVLPGTYVLRETRAPSGFLPAADQDVTITANQRTQVSVVNQPAPPPARIGDLRVFKVASDGRPLAGACFSLIDANGRIFAPVCDAGDGANDGVILFGDVAVGRYTLRETRRPSADYETTPDATVEIREGETVETEIENVLRPGRLLIRKFDPNGVPLPNACFDLIEDGAGAFCTNENGELLFSNLAPGVYRVVETQAPPGFQVAPAPGPVTVRAGSTATLDIVNQPAPPPPDSGSLQVVKFVCPVAEGQDGIVFVDSSNPDGGGLARTAGCLLGDASFALNGPAGPVEFRTGDSGRYQTTLPTGDYVLTELATGASESLVVSLNTLTTVVVINYVAPDEPEPAAIDVIKYTCAPGFQGRVWLDFAEWCVAEETLTNNVTFRLTGPVSARRVTGDAGIGGATRFDGLPAGEYRLREEPPAGTVAVYAFCGLDATAPDGRAVGTALTLILSAGQSVTCQWFNVPEDLSPTTGAITVYKFACPVTVPPTGFDWYGRCDPQGQGVRFSLSAWDGANFVPVTVAATDPDGILRLTQLQPGLYDLQEVDATWCHAESDSVNAQGNVVVEAGERASVWIFNCVGPKRPPNTGAGPMWSGVAPAAPGAFSAIGIGLGLLWPAVGLGLLRRRR